VGADSFADTLLRHSQTLGMVCTYGGHCASFSFLILSLLFSLSLSSPCLARVQVISLAISHRFLTNFISKDVSGVLRSTTHSTAVFNGMFNSDGRLLLGVAAMDVFAEITPEWVYTIASLALFFLFVSRYLSFLHVPFSRHELTVIYATSSVQIERQASHIAAESLVVSDTNLSVTALAALGRLCANHSVPCTLACFRIATCCL